MLPKEVRNRIKKQANEFWGKQSADGTAKARYEGYRRGREDEAQRSQKLVQTLEEIEMTLQLNSREELNIVALMLMAKEAITEYNQ